MPGADTPNPKTSTPSSSNRKATEQQTVKTDKLETTTEAKKETKQGGSIWERKMEAIAARGLVLESKPLPPWLREP